MDLQYKTSITTTKKQSLRNMKANKILSLIIAIVAPLLSFSQDVEMADALRGNGKIYVVVIVLAIIVTGLFGFLIYLDRKVNKLEKEK